MDVSVIVATNSKRDVKENVLMWISLATGLGVLPFAFYRISLLEWPIAFMDFSISVLTLSLFFYVYKTRNLKVANKILIALAFTGVFFTIYLKGSEQVFWAYPASVASFYILKPKTAALLIVPFTFALLALLYSHTSLLHVLTIFMTLSITNLFAYVFATGMSQQRKQLLIQATQDPLTGAGNRRALKERMEHIIAAYQRTQGKSSMLLIDMDYFKKINDNFGHNAGDFFLTELTKIIRSRIRATDNLYRFGGEEFIVLAENTDLAAAQMLAEELRVTIENENIIPATTVTISIGIAQLNADETDEDWIKRADKALFKAKGSGRNKVCSASK